MVLTFLHRIPRNWKKLRNKCLIVSKLYDINRDLKATQPFKKVVLINCYSSCSINKYIWGLLLSIILLRYSDFSGRSCLKRQCSHLCRTHCSSFHRYRGRKNSPLRYWVLCLESVNWADIGQINIKSMHFLMLVLFCGMVGGGVYFTELKIPKKWLYAGSTYIILTKEQYVWDHVKTKEKEAWARGSKLLGSD